MELLGTRYGCWFLPKDIDLNEDSIIYSAGVGEDVSFDMLMSHKHKCEIVLIDPTERAKKHYEEVKHYYEKIKWKMSGGIQEDYYGIMYPLKPDLENITYVDKALWDEKKSDVKFYKQDNKEYVSQSLIKGLFSENHDNVETTTLKDIMDENDHLHIDILKLSINGAEINVLHDMLNENIFPRYICINFSIVRSDKNIQDKIKQILTRLQMVRYKPIYNNKSNKFTFKLVM